MYPEQDVYETYRFLASELNKIGIAYIHIAMAPEIPRKTLDAIREHFDGTLIICNGLTPQTAEKALKDGTADLIAFARLFLANPDLDKRLEEGATFNKIDYSKAYTIGAEGYTDYPVLA